MKKEEDEKVKKVKVEFDCDHDKNCSRNMNSVCKGGGIYGLGFLGAAIYYISTAGSFWTGVLGFLKACIWPLFLVYEALKFLGA